MEIRTRLFADYYKLGDHLKQNYYLQSYIEMRSVHKRLYQEETRVGGRLQRRVSCKYRIPIEIPPSHPSENLSAEDLKSKYKSLLSVHLLGVWFRGVPARPNPVTQVIQSPNGIVTSIVPYLIAWVFIFLCENSQSGRHFM